MRPTLLILTTLWFMLQALPVDACYLAYQHRIYPLGELKSGSAFLETRLERDSKRQNRVETVFWKGQAIVSVWTGEGLEPVFTLEEGLWFTDPEYAEKVNALYARAIDSLETMKGFKALRGQDTRLCDAAQECAGIGITRKDSLLELTLDGQSSLYRFPQDVSDAASSLLGALEPYDFRIMAVRQVETKGASYLLITLAAGDPWDELKNELFKRRQTYKASQPGYPEIVYPHGIGFDLLIKAG